MLQIINFEPVNFSADAKKILLQNFRYSELSWENFYNIATECLADIIIVRFKKYIGKDIINRCPHLRIIVSTTTGTDHIDSAYCKKKNIEILCLKPYPEFLKTIPSTAEHCFALILSLLRNIPAAVESVKSGQWNRELFWGYQLKDKKLGIIGLGRTGLMVAKYAYAFKMKIIYYDPYINNSNYRKIESLVDLIIQADIISIHIPLSDNNFHLINHSLKQFFSSKKYIINTSRGKLIDEHFIYKLLQEDLLGGIASDVLETELDDITKSWLYKALQEKRNVILTPHLGGATHDALHSCEEFISSKLIELVNRKWFLN